jgi:hypothetical protein
VGLEEMGDCRITFEEKVSAGEKRSRLLEIERLEIPTYLTDHVARFAPQRLDLLTTAEMIVDPVPLPGAWCPRIIQQQGPEFSRGVREMTSEGRG